MENLLILTFAKAIDPVGFILVLIICCFAKQKWMIPIIIIVAYLIIESLMVLLNPSRVFGAYLITGLLGTTIQVFFAYFLLNRKKNKSNLDVNKINTGTSHE